MLKIPSIKGRTPRILLITQDYFIIPELLRTMEQHRIEFCSVKFAQNANFLKSLFEKIAEYRPHFILSINHTGLDADGQVLALLKRCGVPFASWFVDYPEMFMTNEVSADSLLSIFCWNPQSIPFFKTKKVQEVHYLPLGTDTSIFKPQNPMPKPTHQVSFVGSSWTYKISEMLRTTRFPAPLLREYRRLGKIFEKDPDINRQSLLKMMAPQAQTALKKLPAHNQKRFYRLIQLEGTKQKRINTVSKLLNFMPVIVGDFYWKQALSEQNKKYSWWNRINYERELPAFYQSSAINFNTTSLQASYAMNQRIFDVPACGSFILTEQNSTLEELFEPGKEVACYRNVDEIKETTTYWLNNPEARKGIIKAAHNRILDQHTYGHRLVQLIKKMKIYF